MKGDEITKRVKGLYERYSFPERPEEIEPDKSIFKPFFNDDVLSKMKSSVALDAGCGTGPNLYCLSTLFKQVYAFDLSQNSVNKASKIVNKYNLKNVELTQGDIFSIPFERKFDYIFSIGVLHHTKNAKEGFKILSKHLNPGGYITIALYNSFGGWKYKIFMRLFNAIKDERKRLEFIKKYYKKDADANLADSYLHPRVTFYSVDDVLGWFREENIEFISLSKPIRFRELISHYRNRNVHDHKRVYTHLDSHFKRIVSQTIWGVHHHSGYFTIIGRKRK